MDEVTELKLKNFEEQFSKINKQLEEMPDKISQNFENIINLRIENSTQKLKIEFYKWLVPLLIGVIATAGTTIFNFIK